ncbi:MAG: ABC transporter substrate-binding protein [Phycisphaerae bacterium]|nr:ABC transporter substrate-binding protein [Phycisphaerae bacterium]
MIRANRRFGASRFGWLAAVAASACVAGWPVAAGDGDEGPGAGPRANEVLFGMSAVLSGQSASLGTSLSLGVRAAFEEANRAGGVHGRKVRLMALDDGYEPSRTAPNMHELIGRRGVIAVVGNVGTPTGVVAAPIASAAGVPFIAPFTGASKLRGAEAGPWVFHFRASYAQEMAAMIGALMDRAGLHADEIGFVTQRDAFGDACYQGALAELRARCDCTKVRVVHARFERNTLAVEGCVGELLMSKRPPRAVIVAAPYAPAAELIRQARAHGLTAEFLCVSFVGPEALAKELQGTGLSAVAMQVTPPAALRRPVHERFEAALRAIGAAGLADSVSLEGYIAGRLALLGLERAGPEPTRARLRAALEGLGSIDLGLGVPLTLTHDRHQASDAVWPVRVSDGTVTPISWDRVIEKPAAIGAAP